MLVKFRRPWYASDGSYYSPGVQEVLGDYQPRKKVNGKVVPLDEKDDPNIFLPSTAVVMADPEEEKSNKASK